jgi:hypothetical protein
MRLGDDIVFRKTLTNKKERGKCLLVLNIYIRQSTIKPVEVMHGGIDHKLYVSKRLRGV